MLANCLPEVDMATFYEYGKDGSHRSYTVEGEPVPFNPHAGFFGAVPYPMPQPAATYNTHGYYGYLVNAHGNWQGQPFANGHQTYPPSTPLRAPQQEEPEGYGFYYAEDNGGETEQQDHMDENRSEEFLEADYSAVDAGSELGISFPDEQPHVQFSAPRWYPDIEPVRGLCDLRGLLQHIQPARLHRAIYGPALDIVEENTDKVFAHKVPKKMLVLMCGRPAILKYVRTIERTEVSPGNVVPLRQELRIPQGVASHIGFKIIIAWMKRACHPKYTQEMKSIRVPKNLFAAISVARTLFFLNLHRDSDRIDTIIANHHFRRPIYPDEVASVWNCLPKDSKYIYGIVNILRDRMNKATQYGSDELHKGLLKLFEDYPQLEARVRDAEVNDMHKPVFSREWCKYIPPSEVAEKNAEEVASGIANLSMGSHEAEFDNGQEEQLGYPKKKDSLGAHEDMQIPGFNRHPFGAQQNHPSEKQQHKQVEAKKGKPFEKYKSRATQMPKHKPFQPKLKPFEPKEHKPFEAEKIKFGVLRIVAPKGKVAADETESESEMMLEDGGGFNQIKW